MNNTKKSAMTLYSLYSQDAKGLMRDLHKLQLGQLLSLFDDSHGDRHQGDQRVHPPSLGLLDCQ